MSRAILCAAIVGLMLCAVRAQTTTTAPAGGWVKLFGDEKWYQEQPGDEKVFQGKLEAIPDADKPGILMRTSYYRLGDRTIYTGAKKVAALDERVGKTVEIRGKVVDMELEGKAVHEVWPKAVRTAE